MRACVRVRVCGLAVAILAGSWCAMGAERQARAIRRSDVVFMYDNPQRYEAYGATVMGWAGRRDADHIRAAHAAGVRQFSCSVGFLTEGRGVIDFSEDFLDAACRNLAGEPFIVPWLWDHQHKGHKYYWWCTNSPLYRKYLFQRLAETVAAGCDGLHIDDYRGTSGSVTWRAGGFCPHCLAAFREYLARHVPAEKLAKLGIRDVKTFDYRRFLLDRGVKPDEYNRRRAGLPLAEEFHHFQVMADNDFVAAYHKRACELAGRKLTLSVNSGLSSPHALVVAPHLSYFCCEVGHGAPRRKPATHPVYIYKLADGLDRPVCSTAAGQDWAFVAEHKTYELVRTWAAMSYAFGHNLMAPHRQWCYTKAKGTHWTEAPTDEYAWVYRFVRAQARLLDGYEAVAPVAVVYDNAANRRGRGRIEGICTDLAAANTPFRVAVAGDHWLPDYRLTAGDLARARAVIVPKQLDLDAAQRTVLDGVKAAGRLVTWPDRAGLTKLVPPPIRIEGAGNLWAVPRAKPGDRKAPVVIHLLNRNYDPKADRIVPRKDVTLHLRRDLLPGRKLTKVTAHAPKAKPLALRATVGDTETTIALSHVGLWTLIELH